MVIDLSVLHPALKNALFSGGKSTLCFLSEQNKLLYCFLYKNKLLHSSSEHFREYSQLLVEKPY